MRRAEKLCKLSACGLWSQGVKPMVSKRKDKTRIRRELTREFIVGFKEKFGRKPSSEEGECFGVGFNMAFNYLKKLNSSDKN